MSKTYSEIQEDLDKAAQALAAQETSLQKQRVMLLDQPPLSRPDALADMRAPTFIIGPVGDFPGMAAGRPDGGRGHLSVAAAQEFSQLLNRAAEAQTPAQREAETAKAANVVAKDVSAHNKKAGPGAQTDQAAFSAMGLRTLIRDNIRQAGDAAGLSPVAAQALSFSVQRALEREGIKTLVNHAVDGVSNWRASAATSATHLGQKYNLDKAMNALAERGVTGDKIKSFVGAHAGKFSTGLSAMEHKDDLARAVVMLRESGATVQGITRVFGDEQVRHAVGDISVNAGQMASSMPGLRAAGSVAVLAGGLLRGDDTSEMGKNILRATAAIAGGAAGAVVGNVFGAVVGAELAHTAMDKLIDKYEQRYEPEKYAAKQQGLSREQLAEHGENIRQASNQLRQADSVQALTHSAQANLSNALTSHMPEAMQSRTRAVEPEAQRELSRELKPSSSAA